MRLKLQKRSEWKFVSRIIPHKQVFNTSQLAAEPVSNACFGVHTRDLFEIGDCHFFCHKGMFIQRSEGDPAGDLVEQKGVKAAVEDVSPSGPIVRG